MFDKKYRVLIWNMNKSNRKHDDHDDAQEINAFSINRVEQLFDFLRFEKGDNFMFVNKSFFCTSSCV